MDYPETLSREVRRAAGAFYTPDWLVEEVTRETLAHVRGDRLRVLDPACGDGRFLVAARKMLGEGATLVGVERDPEAAARARAALPGVEVRVGEALLGGVVPDGAWDVVLGNPPYVRSVALKAGDPELWARLRGAFAATSYREWDLYAAFLDKTIAWLAPGGQAGLVVPSRWLTAATAGPLRERLAGAVRKIVDLGARQIFDGATTYTALVYLSAAASGPVTVSRGGAEGTVVRAGLGRAPWSLAVGAEAGGLARLRAAGPALGDVARIAKGAGTNADPVFFLEPSKEDDGARWSPALGEPVDVEDEVLVPCLRGRDVRPFRAEPGRLALLPYDGNRLRSLAELPPRARAYLERCRALLEAREGGRFRGDAFHAWGRPQNLVWLRDPAPKVVIPDAAARGRAAIDARGTLVADTAYAVRPTRAGVPIQLIYGVLNSPVVGTWLRALGIPLRGDYFRMKTEYLRTLPLPDPARAAHLGALDGDELVAEVMRLYET